MTSSDFLQFLEDERWKRHMSKVEFYEVLLKLSHGAINYVKQGGNLTPKLLERISEALGISATIAIVLDDSPNNIKQVTK